MTCAVTFIQFNDNVAQGEDATAMGMSAVNNGFGTLTISAENSQFNNNVVTDASDSSIAVGLYAQNTGSGSVTVNAINSQFSYNSAGSHNMAIGMEAVNFGAGSLTVRAINSLFAYNTAIGENAYGLGLYAYNAMSGSFAVNTFGSDFYNNSYQGLYISDKGS